MKNFLKNKLIPFFVISVLSLYLIDTIDSLGVVVSKRVKRPKKKKIKKIKKNKSKTEKIVKLDKNKLCDNILKHDFSQWNKNAGNLVIINKNNEIPEGFVPELKKCGEKEVGASIYDNLKKMFDDAKKDKINLWVCSGYRSVERQTKLFNDQVSRVSKDPKHPTSDEIDKASRVVAKPRQSEHNAGLAVDIVCADSKFASSKEYKWLKEHAHNYGFIERYQKGKESKTGCIYEPWHWRYVGVEVAKKIKNSGQCLEEFVIDLMQTKT